MTAEEIRKLFPQASYEEFACVMLQEIAANLADLLELLQSGLIVVRTREQ